MNGRYSVITISWQEILLGLNISEQQNIHKSPTAICFEQHSYYETLAHLNDLDSLLQLTIMRFGLHQRKAISDLIVKSNGLFSVMFLFISSVACDAIDYSYLRSFIWIPQQHSLSSSLVSDPFPGVRIWKGPSWSHLLWRLPLCLSGRVTTVQQIFIWYLVCTCSSSGIEVTRKNEIEVVENPSLTVSNFSFLPEHTGGYIAESLPGDGLYN